jgi:serine O-acetyltransferase
MESKLNRSDLIALVCKQLNNFFADIDSNVIDANMDKALSRTERCLGAINNKYYYSDNILTFNPYHSGQYTTFLYYLANTIYLSGDLSDLPDKVYYLNKIMNSVDWYYKIDLPEKFSMEHPIGSVLGRASYSDRLFIYQGVTVGGNKGYYPTIGENVLLYSNSTVLGKTILGDNIIVSSGCYIKDEIIPECSIVFGQSPNLIVKQKDSQYMKSMLPPWKL